MRAYTTSVSSCSTLLLTFGDTEDLPWESPSPGLQGRRDEEGSGARAYHGKAAGLRSQSRQSGHCCQSGGAGDPPVPSWRLQDGDCLARLLSSNSWHARSRLLGACQNFLQCNTEPALLAAACQNKLNRRGKVIKISFINTIPHRPGEAELLSDHVITMASLFPNLEEILPKSTTAPSPAPLSISNYFYFTP